MKILYISVPSFFDLEISLVRELARIVDLNVLLIVQPESMHSSAFSIDELMDKPCIVPASKFRGMEQYKEMIDFSIWNVANNPDNSYRSCWKLGRLINKYVNEGEFDVVHCTTECKTMLVASFFLGDLNKSIYTLHDPIPHSKKSLIKEWVVNRYYKTYRNYLILSESHRNIMTRIAPNKPVFVSSLGPYDFLSNYEINPNLYGEYMLFIGKIQPYKGVDLLIRAYNISEAPKKGIKLLIAGKGNVKNIDQKDLNENIIIINRYIENGELASLIANCAFGVLPYRSATQSGVLMSYYAFNKPALATNVGDFPLSINNGVNGILCQPGSIESLSNGINKMIVSSVDSFALSIQNEYASNGLKSWTQIASNLLEIYMSIRDEQLGKT